MNITRSKAGSRCLFCALLCACLCLPTTAPGDWSGQGRYAATLEVGIEERDLKIDICFKDTAVHRLAELTGQPTAAPADPTEIAMHLLRVSVGKNATAPLQLVVSQPVGGDAVNRLDCAAPGMSSHGVKLQLSMPPETRQLSLTPPKDARNDDLGLMVLDHGVPVADLGGFLRPLVIKLDPADPWNSRVDDPTFIRQHNEPRSYLYVEPYEVRHELLLRADQLLSSLDPGTDSRRVIPSAQQPALLERIGELLLHHNALEIDGADSVPMLEHVEFVRYSRSGVKAVDGIQDIDSRSALIGARLVYATEQPAHSLSLHWDLFGSTHAQRPVSVIIGPESFDGYVTADTPVFDWTRDDGFDPIPSAGDEAALPPGEESVAGPSDGRESPRPFLPYLLAAALCAALAFWGTRQKARAGLASGVLAAAILLLCLAWYEHRSTLSTVRVDGQEWVSDTLQPLLKNAYRAFQIRGEEAAYDRLAVSLASPLLDDIYLQQRRALLRQQEGLGGEGRIERIEIVQADVVHAHRRTGVYEVNAHWIAHGTVSHWGHSHPRHNAYRAQIKLQPDREGHWKIIDLRFLDGQRLSADERA